MDDAGRGPAERYRAALPGLRHELAIDGYDRAGVPTVSAEWSSPGAPASGPAAQTGVGYGGTPGAAATGAWGELTEELLLARYVARVPPVPGSFAGLLRSRGADRIADPVSLVLPAGSSTTTARHDGWRTGSRRSWPTTPPGTRPCRRPT